MNVVLLNGQIMSDLTVIKGKACAKFWLKQEDEIGSLSVCCFVTLEVYRKMIEAGVAKFSCLQVTNGRLMVKRSEKEGVERDCIGIWVNQWELAEYRYTTVLSDGKLPI